MSIRSIVTAAILLALLLAGVGAAYYAGLGPAPGGSGSDAPLTDDPTGTPLGSAAAGGGTANGETVAPLSVQSIEECGQTCRDVTVSLTNNRGQSASNVVAFTKIYAGQDGTAEEDLVWSGREAVGTLEAGGTHTTTQRVELSLRDGLEIENHDGWVTVVTTVKTDERTVTFTGVEQVA